MRWREVNDQALWRGIILLLTWGYIRKRIVCFRTVAPARNRATGNEAADKGTTVRPLKKLGQRPETVSISNQSTGSLWNMITTSSSLINLCKKTSEIKRKDEMLPRIPFYFCKASLKIISKCCMTLVHIMPLGKKSKEHYFVLLLERISTKAVDINFHKKLMVAVDQKTPSLGC